MPDLMHCVYASAAPRHFETAELTALLQAALKPNDRAELSGICFTPSSVFFRCGKEFPTRRRRYTPGLNWTSATRK